MPIYRLVYILQNDRFATYPEIRTWPRFLFNAPTHQVSSSMFNRSEVIVLRNTNTCVASACTNTHLC